MIFISAFAFTENNSSIVKTEFGIIHANNVNEARGMFYDKLQKESPNIQVIALQVGSAPFEMQDPVTQKNMLEFKKQREEKMRKDAGIELPEDQGPNMADLEKAVEKAIKSVEKSTKEEQEKARKEK